MGISCLELGPLHGGGENCFCSRVPVRGEAAVASWWPEPGQGVREARALGTGQCLNVAPTRCPEATKYSIEHASRQGPGTQETRTTWGHGRLGSQEPAGPRMELPPEDYGAQPPRASGLTPDDEEEEEALTQDPFTTVRSGLDGQAPALPGCWGVRVGADHQTADTQERKAGKD